MPQQLTFSIDKIRGVTVTRTLGYMETDAFLIPEKRPIVEEK
ncbi:MAG: hypothetical protein ACQEV7_19575 [Bacillota bacterium]